MTKGTPSFGKKNKKTHIICRRCGKRSYHARDKKCSACGFGGGSRLRKFSWQWKSILGKGSRKK